MSNSPSLQSPHKTSGSPNTSNVHSPSSSPISSNQRGVAATSTGAVFGMPMSSSAGLKSLNSNWQQMWGATNSPSQRHPSGGSSTGAVDANGVRDTWSSSRPTSGTWEMPSQTGDVTSSPQRKDYSARAGSPASRAARNTMQNSRMDEHSGSLSKPGSFSPQRFEGTIKEANGASRFASVASPTKASGFNTSSPFTNGQGASGGYDSNHGSSVDDITLGLRGMAVADEYGTGHQASYRSVSMPQPHATGATRGPQVVQTRPSFNAYTAQDYASYYAGPSAMDYSYGYDTYRNNPDAAIYGSPATVNGATTASSMYPAVGSQDVRQPGNVYYDYAGSARPPTSQYYFTAPQAMVYHHAAPPHSPLTATQIPHAAPATITDKKRELQYAIQQQQQLTHQQNLLYASMRHASGGPHAQAFVTPLDYAAAQLPLLVPNAAVFAHASSPQALMYPQSINGVRKSEGVESTLRSPLLDEFRANKSRKWELKDIFGYVVEFSGDQHGSRFIQQKLETATSEEKQIVFDEIVPDAAIQLMQDVFGNYVIQKLFEHGTQIQKTILANTMEGHILPLSLQMYGCRVVQKAVEYILPDQQASFVKELDAHVLKCVKDANGNHVIQKLIERVSPDRLAFVQAFRGNVYELSTHPYGCRVLQRCFEHLHDEQTRPLLDELHKYTINLMQDQFGNYVVQFVLERGKHHDRVLIISKLRGQMLQMARHKFASNVCEKALVTADPENRRALIEEIMTPKQDGVSPIVTMMKDQYANYVLQRALTVVEGDQKEILIGKVRPQLTAMRRYSSAYSRHLVSIEKLLDKAAAQSSPLDPKVAIATIEPNGDRSL